MKGWVGPDAVLAMMRVVESGMRLCVGWVENGAQCSKDDEARRDKKCLEGQTFRCKPCHLFQISSVSKRRNPRPSSVPEPPSPRDPHTSPDLPSSIWYIQSLFSPCWFQPCSLDSRSKPLVLQLGFGFHHLSLTKHFASMYAEAFASRVVAFILTCP